MNIKTNCSALLLALLCLSCTLLGGKKKDKEPTLEEQGVNTQHLLEFNECEGTYNGKAFTIGDSIDHMVKVFGPYNRQFDAYTYIWDSIGMIMGCNFYGQEPRNKVSSICISWNIYISDTWSSEDKEFKEELIARKPKKLFQGNILVGGVPFGRGMNVDDFREKCDWYFAPDFYPDAYEYKMWTCNSPLDKIKNTNYKLQYTLETSGKLYIDEFLFGAVLR